MRNTGLSTIKNRRKAFTLIELLVVISIIALLLAILMPALARIRKQAKNVVDKMNLKQWALIFSMYTSDNNSNFFGYSVSTSPGLWMKVLYPYYKQRKEILCCPMATKPMNDISGNLTSARAPFAAWGIFTDWWASDGDPVWGSYGINDWVLNIPGGYGPAKEENHWKSVNVKNSSNIPLLLDCSWVDGWPDSSDKPPTYDGQWDYWALNNNMQRYCINRHDGTVNVLFLDSSVRSIGLKQLWRLKWHRTYNLNAPLPVWVTEAPWMKNFKDYK